MTPVALLMALSLNPSPQAPATTRTQPKTYFVATTGSDTNPGSREEPFQTIQKGADSLGRGDTLVIQGGVYREYVALARSGAYFDRNLKIQAAPGAEVVIDGEGLTPSTPRQALFDTNGADYLEIRGLTTRNSPVAGIVVRGSWRVRLEDCHTVNTARSGILVDKAQDVVLQGCEVEKACLRGGEESISVKRSADVTVRQCHVHDTMHEGIDVKEGSRHVRVLNNHVHHVERQGLYADAWDSHTYDIRFEGNRVHDCMMGLAACTESGGLLQDVWFVNNVIYDCKGPGMILAKWGHQEMRHDIRDVYFLNNTVVNCGNGGKDGVWGGSMLLENDQAENVWVMNNIFSGSPQDQMRVRHFDLAPKNMEVRNNLVGGPSERFGRGNLYTTPRFVDPARKDFRLHPESPGIDEGAKTPWGGTTDAAGTRRLQGKGIDIGAFETR
ncbi:MAG TPA: right-handed parallel beta-helix repeat-containing protein [Fimbriimonas sp.]